MSKLPLLSSLFGSDEPAPAVIVEAVAPATERIEIIDADDTGKPKNADAAHGREGYEIPYSMTVHYFNGDLTVELNMVDATLVATHGMEDSSFSYEYGSERGTGGGKYWTFTDLKWKDPKIPHAVENYDLFQLPPEQVQHIAAFVKKALETMDEDDITNHIDVDHWADKLTPEPHFNEPDDY